MMRWSSSICHLIFISAVTRQIACRVDLSARAVYESDWHGCPRQRDALGLGWVYMAPKEGRPGIIRRQEVVAVSLPIWR